MTFVVVYGFNQPLGVQFVLPLRHITLYFRYIIGNTCCTFEYTHETFLCLIAIDDEKRMCHEASNTERVLYVFKRSRASVS